MGSPDSEELSQRVIKAKQLAAREKKQRLKLALEELQKFEQNRQESEKAWRVSESDPEARMMKQSDGGFAPSYNVQVCTEASNKIIVAVETTQAGTDSGPRVGQPWGLSYRTMVDSYDAKRHCGRQRRKIYPLRSSINDDRPLDRSQVWG